MHIETVAHRVYSPEEKREHVVNYFSCKHGFKNAYLQEHDLTTRQLYRWRDQLIGGDIDTGLIPRKTVVMSHDEANEMKRLRALAKEQQKQIEQLQLQLAEKERQTQAHARAVDSLGKAIAIMHGRIDD